MPHQAESLTIQGFGVQKQSIVISGTGLYDPPYTITNDELVVAFNAFVRHYNEAHRAGIESGEIEPLLESSTDFIVKASGIESRKVMDKSGILDPEIMCPRLPRRSNDELSIQAEMAVAAAQEALRAAHKTAADVDAVLVACSNMQRAYPAMAVEIQNALGITGFGFDMNVACSSATFGIQTATDMVNNGHARCVLMVNPEICSGHLNFRDRDCHFIFGDVCTAVVLESAQTCTATDAFEILGTKLKTQFSNNIRNNAGFLNRTEAAPLPGDSDRLFVQQGRKVFKEVSPAVAELIKAHLDDLSLTPSDLRRFWLHQANLNMNQLIIRKVLSRDPHPGEAPVVLDEYANTSSAGSIIAFHKHKSDLSIGDMGLICSFGAGYSVGNVVVRKIS
ncbi:MAG: beta-ketoacyl-ACP synthase III [Gammaproteobacteria bacterium]|nr:beta-ketoacyl-ACP synthase III [Gammaproteobacteria bacterium]MCP5459024.1 beta-ketoacyl-ACP synthase III [Gammaproteobacteria bacterium]